MKRGSGAALLPFHTAGVREAGCDEAGRGCLAGPVFAAAVILPPDFTDDTLTDSKQMSAKARYRLREKIERKAVAWAVAEVSAEEIDKINILNASILAMHRALDRLGIVPQHVIVDGNRFRQWHDVPYDTVVKGDGKYFSIAAASVLAKTYRDDKMERLAHEYPGYGWERNKGYPTEEHRRAIEALGVTPYHRMSFTLLDTQQELDFG